MELRLARGDRRKKVTYEAAMDSLPDSCFVQIGGRAYLVWGDCFGRRKGIRDISPGRIQRRRY